MGLDMYLNKRMYVSFLGKGGRSEKTTVTVENQSPDGSKNIRTFTVTNPESGVQVVLPVAYWRKQNAIHRWFVENCGEGQDNCEPYRVSKNKLKELMNTCKEVIENPEKAPELLPTQCGFFFGGTDYDEDYFEGLKYTVEALQDIDEDACEYTYLASW